MYIDDVLITRKTEEKHLYTLDEVVRRLREAGLHLKKSKCVFKGSSVVYMGHRIDAEGLHPMADKLQAVQDTPCPKNVSKLKS